MPRKKSTSLTDAELRLMEVVWERGRVTVADVVDNLPKDVSLAYSTVLTTLRILETKGYIKHEKDGRAFIYRAVVKREQARANALTHLLRRFFDDSPELLMLNLLDAKKISVEELSKLRKKIEGKEPLMHLGSRTFAEGYQVSTDKDVFHTGKQSLRIEKTP